MDSPNFDLGEDVRSEARILQDLSWSNAVADGRKQLSDREAYIVHSIELRSAIINYHVVSMLCKALLNSKSILYSVQPEILRRIVEFSFPGLGAFVTTNRLQGHYSTSSINSPNNVIPFRICARKRPLMPFEIAMGAYDVIHAKQLSNQCILHDGRVGRHGRRLTMTHHTYHLHKLWNENASTVSVCKDEVLPLLVNVEKGYDSTLICYGQTGTGKTFTLVGAIDYISRNIVGAVVRVCFYEIHGKRCYDLLNARSLVHLRSDRQENVHVCGVRRVDLQITEPNTLHNLLTDALQLRSCEVTERNPISSRSHAICCIEFLSNASSTSSNASTPTLTLVDLAGSERNYETIQMTAAQHRESALINLSLMALKNCFTTFHNQIVTKSPPALSTTTPSLGAHRGTTTASSSAASSPSQRMPYRSSPLTRVLRKCFLEDASHRTTIIATLSPSPIDLQHSLNTLQHVVKMCPPLAADIDVCTLEVPILGAPLSHVPVSAWSSAEVQGWLGTVDGGRFAHLVLPAELDGEGLMQLEESSLAALFAGELRQARQEEEGSAWVVEGDASEAHLAIGGALWRALRREDASARLMQRAINE